MSEITNPSQTPAKHVPSPTEKTSEENKVDRIANDAAKKAGKTEERYDGNHDIFDK